MNDSKVTMERIAKELNISRTTVYRAIYNLPRVSKQTRERVKKLVEKYDYHPNITAKNLASRRTGRIGIVLENLFVPIRNILSQYLIDMINGRSYKVVLETFDSNNVEGFMKKIQADILGGSYDGLLIEPDLFHFKGDKFKEIIEKIQRNKFPFIFLSASAKWPGVDFVSTNRYEGGYKAIKYLIELGHRRIAIVSILDYPEYNQIEPRYEAYRKALKDNNLEVNPKWILPIEHAGALEGYNAGLKIAEMKDKPTAIFCINDFVAMGVLKALKESGIRVPDDISVVGFDNIELSNFAIVPLTTIAQPVNEISFEAINLLFRKISNPDTPTRQIYIDPKLIIRNSCKSCGKD